MSASTLSMFAMLAEGKGGGKTGDFGFLVERVSAVSWPCSREPSQITRCCRVMYTVEWNCIVFYSKLQKILS